MCEFKTVLKTHVYIRMAPNKFEGLFLWTAFHLLLKYVYVYKGVFDYNVLDYNMY